MNEWACFVPLRAKASLKGKFDQSSCGELVHMIVFVFIIYCSSLCSSLCRVFQLLRFLAALDQCTLAFFRKESIHLLAGLPRCLLPVRESHIVEIWSLATCPPHFHFRISARPAMSSVFASSLILVLGILSLSEMPRFLVPFSLADLEVFLLHSGQIPGLTSIS